VETKTEHRGPSGPILALSPDPQILDHLGPALACDGLALAPVRSLADLIQCLTVGVGPGSAALRAALVLVDTAALGDPDELLALAPLVDGPNGGGLPLVCLAEGSDLHSRLAALRAGAVDFVPKESDPGQLVARIRALMGAEGEAPPRILVVDDQPVSALFAARVLEGAGMVTERVEDSLAVLDVLQAFRPDLILMDLHMPGASGIELTRIIREQPRFADLPIVFLSVEMDPGQQLNALRVGGNDFLAKPVPPEVLLGCVRRRLAEARRRALDHASRAAVDPITGLASREHLLEQLDRQLALGAASEWALVYLEHAWEAPLLRRVVAAIAEVKAPDDLLARAGEHGLGILIRREERESIARFASQLVEGVRAALSQGVPGGGFGIGWCPLQLGGDEAVTLVSRARKAAQLGLDGGTGGPVAYLRAPSPPRGEDRGPILAAIEEARFELLYQPIVDLFDATRERYEVLLRLRLPDGELLVPRAFAPLAARAGLAERVDRWTLLAALKVLDACRAAGRSVELLIPQTMAALAAGHWAEALRQAIDARDLIRVRPLIQLQLTDVDRHLALAARSARELERIGIRLCLDAYSDGPRGDRVLAAVPVALVRLPLETTRGWRPERLKELVGRIQQHRARVVATGADGPEAIARVCAAGVSLIQGPFVQPPLESMGFDFASTAPNA
jgi:CheY-like chemotaxis protein